MYSVLRTRAFAVALAALVLVGSATLAHAQTTSIPLGRSIVCSIFDRLIADGVLRPSKACGTTPTPPPPQQGQLTVIKNVVGGTSTPSMFMLRVSSGGNATTSFAGSSLGTTLNVAGGAAYNVTEDAATNYSSSFSANCSGTMPAGGTRTCTVTNTFTGTTTPPTLSSLKVMKIVSGGTATSSDFLVHVHNASAGMVDVSGSPQAGSMTGTTYMNLGAAIYHVEETGGPANYAASFSGDCDSSGHITLTGASTTKTCTITNTFVPATSTLRVIKLVQGNANATSSDFQISVMNNGSNVAGSPAAGSMTGTSYVNLGAGTYVVSEPVNANYTMSFSGDCDAGGSVMFTSTTSAMKTCTITNTFVPAPTSMLSVYKVVNGGTASSSAFQVYVKSATTSLDVMGSPQMGNASGTAYTLGFGSYVISEASTTDYSLAFSGDCNASGMVTLSATGTKTCTLTNTFTGTTTASTTDDGLITLGLNPTINNLIDWIRSLVRR